MGCLAVAVGVRLKGRGMEGWETRKGREVMAGRRREGLMEGAKEVIKAEVIALCSRWERGEGELSVEM